MSLTLDCATNSPDAVIASSVAGVASRTLVYSPEYLGLVPTRAIHVSAFSGVSWPRRTSAAAAAAGPRCLP